ncbi:MAG: putative DNA modification/repair radical SAM protein [Oscillospiraceae bacterium]|nr:putative DNA modification/repair radical SAM protein [Oscillospiraceae bacterium]
MDVQDKLAVLTGAAKYDAACTSSGSDRPGVAGMLGSACAGGICHSFAADGRCISLLKVLQTNVCVYDCQYCVNRASNDVPRATLAPEELADMTMEFYRRNYIEGLFLSSGVMGTPDLSMERMCRTLELLRYTHRFNGYIHAKAIPGCSPALVEKLGLLCDRMSVNIELPSRQSLEALAPDKSKANILLPMARIRDGIAENKADLAVYRHAPRFTPAGQSTQMIVGASPESDLQIMRLADALYKKYSLKRVFYSAYIPVGTHALLPKNVPPPLLREHRLYQTDWLLRKYGFGIDELLDEQSPSLDPLLDPKCQWALRHLDAFPVEVNRADEATLLRVPGIGVTSARRIVIARRQGALRFEDLKKMGIVLKRAVYFITCLGRMADGTKLTHEFIYHNLTADVRLHPGRLPIGMPGNMDVQQLTWVDVPALLPGRRETVAAMTGQL